MKDDFTEHRAAKLYRKLKTQLSALPPDRMESVDRYLKGDPMSTDSDFERQLDQAVIAVLTSGTPPKPKRHRFSRLWEDELEKKLDALPLEERAAARAEAEAAEIAARKERYKTGNRERARRRRSQLHGNSDTVLIELALPRWLAEVLVPPHWERKPLSKAEARGAQIVKILKDWYERQQRG